MAATFQSLLKAFVVAMLASGFTLILSNLSFFTLLEHKGLDFLFTLRGTLAPPESIVIVAIDEPSLAEIPQQWPWPRGTHARLIQQLKKAGAKVIGFDVLFAEPSTMVEDHLLAQALQEADNVVLVSALAIVNDPLFRLTSRVDPLPAFSKVADVGNPMMMIDADGIVRRARLLYPGMPSFALRVIGKVVSDAQRGKISKQNLSKEVLINYPGPPRTVKTVSYYQALDYEHLLPSDSFKGKIVLIGRSLETIPEPQNLSGDTFLTPFSWVAGSATAGVEIQAVLIDNLLRGNFITQLSPLMQTTLLLALTLMASLIIMRLRPLLALIALAMMMSLIFFIAHTTFTSINVWLPFISASIGLGVVYAGHLLLRTLAAERDRRRALEEANRTLEASIAERTQELSALNRELGERHQRLEAAYQELASTQNQLISSEKMASLGLLVSGIAHELNNPISYIHSNLEFIEEYTNRLITTVGVSSGREEREHQKAQGDDEHKPAVPPDAIDETLKQLIQSCRNGAERVKQIVLDLRTFSRSDDSGLIMADLHSGLDSTLNLLGKEYHDRITVHRDFGVIPTVECYPGQINQVFMNLLHNAAQAIPQKGTVWLKTELCASGVRITIRDNGVGIMQEDLSKVFDPFFTKKDVGEGMGLGLSISYGIIKKHRGTIKVDSQLNQGTEFVIELPLRFTR